MIGAHFEFILIVTGLLTAAAILQFIAPAPILRIVFGEEPKDLPSLAFAVGDSIIALVYVLYLAGF